MSDDVSRHKKKSSRGLSTSGLAPPASSTPALSIPTGSKDGSDLAAQSSPNLKDRKKSKKEIVTSPRLSLVVPDPSKHGKDKEKDKKDKLKASASKESVPSKKEDDPAASFPNLTGVLYKYNGSFKGWKKRQFALKDGSLMYYVHNKPRLNVDVSGAVIIVNKNSTRFEIDTGVEILHLRAKTPADRDAWVKSFTDTKKLLKEAKRAAVEVNAQAKDLKSALSGRAESLEMSLKLAKSFQAVLATQLDVLKAETPAAAGAAGGDDKKKRKHVRTKSDAGDEQDQGGQHNFVQQATEFQKVSAKFLEAAEAVVKDYLTAVGQIEKGLDHEKAQNSKLKERVKHLQAKNGSLRKAADVALPEGGDGPDGDEIEDVNLIGPFTASDSSGESDSDMYYDPMSDTSSDVGSTSSEPNDQDLADFDEEKPATAAAGPNSPAQPGKAPLDTSSPKQPRLSKASVERRASLILQGGTNKSRRGSTGGDGELAPKRTSSQVDIDLADWESVMTTVPQGTKFRESLPRDKDWKSRVSLVKILRDAIGKDLSRITIPVQFSEPVNTLQRLVEDLQYCELLTKAATIKDSLQRILYVSGFAVSNYSATPGRLGKPFNPILGETYEWVNHEKGIRLFTEQVSHHPQISACHCEARDWIFWGHVLMKNKFWGKTLEILPSGIAHVNIPKFGDHFIWEKVTTCIHNVLVGTKWIDHYGEMSIINQTTKDKVILEFKKCGWFDANHYEIAGGAYDATNTLKYRVSGKWNEGLVAVPVKDDNTEGEPIQLWTANPFPANYQQQYMFTKFAMQVNELTDWMKPMLPPTDTRLRPDQRALENGDIDLAQNEKARLEDKQRAARKVLEEKGAVWKPVFFDKSPAGDWVTNNKYWKHRATKKWPDSPDLF